MFSPKNTHIWGFRRVLYSFLLLLALFFLTQCGLPEFAVVAKPSKLSNTDTLRATVIGFQTPSDDANIQGYALYYKVYASDSDYNGEKDESYFGDNIGSDTELQPGSLLPKSRGFVLAGHLDATDLPESAYTIRHTDAGDNILIDFDPSRDPIVRLGPLSASNPALHTLARGFVDYRSESSNQLRRFVDDWAFRGDFIDGDLRRPPARQPGSQAADYARNSQRLNIVNEIVIGFVVYSVGFSPATTGPLVSRPVHIGKIKYSGIQENTRRIGGF